MASGPMPLAIERVVLNTKMLIRYYPFSTTHRVPQGSRGVCFPLLEPVCASAERLFVQKFSRQHFVLGSLKSANQIVGDSLKSFISCAPAKEHATVANGR